MAHGRDDVRGDVVGVTPQRREHNGLTQLYGVAALGLHAVETGLSPFASQSDAASRSHGQTLALFGRDVGCGDAAVHLERGARKVGRLVAGKE